MILLALDVLDLNIVTSKFVCSTSVYILVFLNIDETHQRFVIRVDCIAFKRVKNVLVLLDEMNNDVQLSLVNIVIALNEIERNAVVKNKFHLIFLQLTNANIFIIC